MLRDLCLAGALQQVCITIDTSRMRRRSTLGMGTGVAPVRFADMPAFEPAIRASRHSVVPRQLSFNSNSSQCSNASAEPGKRRTISSFRSNRTKPHERPNAANTNESVMDGIAELTQSMSESSITTKGSTTVVSNCQQVQAAEVTACSLSSSGPGLQTSVAKTFPKSTIAHKSSASMTESVSKIPRFNSSTSKTSTSKSSTSKSSTPKSSLTSMAQLNSTDAFEEAEIDAMTSTPHPTGSARLSASHASTMDLRDFAEQQRFMMQVLKLSFQKMNKLADSQLALNLLLADVLKELKSRQGSDNLAQNTRNEPQPKLGECNGDMPLNVLAPSQEDNKENFSGHLLRPDHIFNAMKSELRCLKTPTVLKSGGHLVPDTPNTLLSNTVHHQLEDLFESSEPESPVILH